MIFLVSLKSVERFELRREKKCSIMVRSSVRIREVRVKVIGSALQPLEHLEKSAYPIATRLKDIEHCDT